jgi:hypothetical protein
VAEPVAVSRASAAALLERLGVPAGGGGGTAGR